MTLADVDKAFEDLSTIEYEDLIHCLQPMPRVTLDDARALMCLCESMGDPDTLGTLGKASITRRNANRGLVPSTEQVENTLRNVLCSFTSGALNVTSEIGR